MALKAKELKLLADVALGKVKADLVLANATLVNVYTGEVQPGYSVAVKGERIAYVGPDAGHTIGPETNVVDLSGKVILPGFIDGHMHLFWYYRPDEFIKHSMKGGTTAIVTESGEFFFTMGYQGALSFYEAVHIQPVKVYITLPSMLTISPVDKPHSIRRSAAREFYRRKDVVGLGETIQWPAVLKGDKRLLDLYALTISLGKKVEGHTAGARNSKLVALAAAGISDCHEPISAEEVMERARLGMYVLIREGSVRRDLKVVAELKDKNIDFRRLILATDGLSPDDLLQYGHMEYLVQKAIDLGIDPVKAVQMVTLNVAERFDLDVDIGGIAPGRFADMVVVPDLRTIRAEYVYSNGQLVAQGGRLLVPPVVPDFPPSARQTIRLEPKFGPADFAIRVAGGKPVKVRVIQMHTGLVTREQQVEFSLQDGAIRSEPGRDILKVSAIERAFRSGKKFTGLISGFGLKSGAIACSDSWDSTDLLVVGANDLDMAVAVNRVVELQGGMVVCNGGHVLAEWPLPIAGMLSDEPVETMQRQLRNVHEKARELGCTLPDAHLSLTMLTSAAVPYLRICESGLFDIEKGEIVPLVVK